MARRSKKKKKRKGHIDPGDERLVRGRSPREDFLIDFFHFYEGYKEFYGRDPFHELPRYLRSKLLNIMVGLFKYSGKSPIEAGDAYRIVMEYAVEKLKSDPDVDISTIDVRKDGSPDSTITFSCDDSQDLYSHVASMLEPKGSLLKAAHAASLVFRLPGPQTLKGPVVSYGKMLIVELYHRTLDLLRIGTPTNFRVSDETAKNLNNRVWGLLNDSNIFEIKTELYERLKVTAINHVGSKVGIDGLNEVLESAPPEAELITHDEKVRFMAALTEMSEQQDMPDHFPFETIYFALDRPLQMHPTEVTNLYDLPSRLAQGVWVYAFLVTPREAYTLITVDDLENGYATISIIPEFGPYQDPTHKKRWGVTSSFNAFVFPWLVDWVNDHQTTIDETGKFSYRRSYKKIASKFGHTKPIPRPYYTVYIKDERLEEFEKTQTAKSRRKCEHQFSVRGHWVCRYARGPLPLDPKLERKLRKDKRRKIFTVERPDPETASHLARRGVPPKRVDEWMSVLLYWRSDHRRGPEDGPFIPSIRKSSKYKEAKDGLVDQGFAANL